MKKFLILTAATMMAGSAMAEVTLSKSETSDEMQLMGEAMSPNGQYVVGVNYATFAPCIWDVVNNTYTECPELEEGTFTAIANDGFALGDDGDYAVVRTVDGEVITLFVNEGEEVYNEEWDFWYSTGDAGSGAYCMTEDHETIFGYYFDSSYTTSPCYWRNGQRYDLPIPTAEEAGFGVDGAEVRWCTPDGKLLLGFVMDWMSTWPACIWRLQEDGTYAVDVIAKDFYEEDYGMGKPYMLFTPYGLSENGEWVSLCVQEEYDWFNGDWGTTQMARLNLNSGALEVLADDLGMQTTPSAIANDGTMGIITNALSGMVGRTAMIWKAGAPEAVELSALTGEFEEMEGLMCNTICVLSADGKKIQGFAMVDNDNADIFSYVFDLSDVVKLDRVNVENAAVYYNLMGQRVEKITAPGLYVKSNR